jgi:predicted HAD superfamily Cof-like phosphohydrolase
MANEATDHLFADIRDFHRKFQLLQTADPGHRLSREMLEFRIKFMLEELLEYAAAVNAEIECGSHGEFVRIGAEEFDAEQAFDALIDLVYVALGTAYLHRFPFNEGWARVQAANMKKVRAARAEESKRKTVFDVVKPEGWEPPKLDDLLTDVVCSEDIGFKP